MNSHERGSSKWTSPILALLVSASAALAVAQPVCTPTPPPSNVSYVGQTTGCGDSGTGNQNCVVGETVNFVVGTIPPGCPATYTWQFEDGPLSGPRIIDHQFPNPGTFTVTVTITDQSGSIQRVRTVGVVSAAEIPVQSRSVYCHFVDRACFIRAMQIEVTARWHEDRPRSTALLVGRSRKQKGPPCGGPDTLRFGGESYEVRSGTGTGAGGCATGVATSVDGPEPGAMVIVSPGLASG